MPIRIVVFRQQRPCCGKGVIRMPCNKNLALASVLESLGISPKTLTRGVKGLDT